MKPSNRVVARDVTEHPASDSQRYDPKDSRADDSRCEYTSQGNHRAEEKPHPLDIVRIQVMGDPRKPVKASPFPSPRSGKLRAP
jgi:hypothetical protein